MILQASQEMSPARPRLRAVRHHFWAWTEANWRFAAMPDVAKTHAFGLNTNLKIVTSENHALTLVLVKHVF